ncbi:hypothetical protein J2736_006679 [Paenibacillus qinlingensis]|uniref:Nucleotidyltransferase n=1 Tax=Paenibacillus qinlingensis TaxID=1837343 RepID=A0ABU1P6N4_9BACL|nr:hypothetical protein [Paenibacillus qinlingensis]
MDRRSRWRTLMYRMVYAMAVKISLALQRIGELHLLSKKRSLTFNEIVELNHCLSANSDYWLRMAYLENWSLLHYMIDDFDAVQTVCQEIERMKESLHY